MKNKYYELGKNFLSFDLKVNLEKAIRQNDFSTCDPKIVLEIHIVFRNYVVITKLIRSYELTSNTKIEQIWKDLNNG